MESRVNYILVGLFVLLLGAALVAGTLWLSIGGPRTDYDHYLVYMKESVNGLSSDAPVKYRGVNVGRVVTIGIDPRDPSRVRLLLEVEHATPINSSTLATLEMQGLTGIAHINLTGTRGNAAPLKKAADEEYPVIPSKPSLFGRLDTSMTELIAKLTEATDRLNRALNNKNQAALGETLQNLREVSQTLASRSKALGQTLDHLAGTMRSANKVGAQLPALVKQIDVSAKAVETMANDVSRTANNTNTQVNQVARSIMPQSQMLLEELRETARNLRHLSRDLARDPSVIVYGAPKPPPGPGE